MDSDNWSIPNDNSWDTNDPDTVGMEFDRDETGSLEVRVEETPDLDIEMLLAETSTDLNPAPPTNPTTTSPQWPQWHSVDHFDARVDVLLKIYQKAGQEYRGLTDDAHLAMAVDIEEERYFISPTLEAYKNTNSLEVEPNHTGNTEQLSDFDLPYPRRLVALKNPTQNDVLFGGIIGSLPRLTAEYLNLIAANRAPYARATGNEKGSIEDNIITTIESNSGRFLKRYIEGKQTAWIEILPIEVKKIVQRDLNDQPSTSYIRKWKAISKLVCCFR